jgi:hypothetical protein
LGAHEIIILNIVKQEEYVASLDPIDESDKFDIIVSKWKKHFYHCDELKMCGTQ